LSPSDVAWCQCWYYTAMLVCAEIKEFYHGQTVRLPCTTTRRNYVDWEFYRSENSQKEKVYVNGIIDRHFAQYSVEYPLVITNATADQAGKYVCKENAGIGSVAASYKLIYGGDLLLYYAYFLIVMFNPLTPTVNIWV